MKLIIKINPPHSDLATNEEALAGAAEAAIDALRELIGMSGSVTPGVRFSLDWVGGWWKVEE